MTAHAALMKSNSTVINHTGIQRRQASLSVLGDNSVPVWESRLSFYVGIKTKYSGSVAKGSNFFSHCLVIWVEIKTLCGKKNRSVKESGSLMAIQWSSVEEFALNLYENQDPGSVAKGSDYLYRQLKIFMGIKTLNDSSVVELRVTRDFNHHRFSGIFPCHHRFSVFFSDFYSASAYGVVQMYHAA